MSRHQLVRGLPIGGAIAVMWVAAFAWTQQGPAYARVLAQHVPARVATTTAVPATLHGEAPFVPRVHQLPGGDLGIELFSSPHWRLLRHFPSGYLDVYAADGAGDWRRLELSLEWRRNTHPMLAFAAPRGLYLVGYDVVANLPSGGRPEAVREGFDLHLITSAGRGTSTRLAEQLKLGGIDTLLYGSVRGDAIDLCGGSRCVSIDSKRRVFEWPLEKLKAHDFVEVAFSDSGAVALVRSRTDEAVGRESPVPPHPFQVASMSPSGVTLQNLSEEEGVPWGLEWAGQGAVLRFARSTPEYRALLEYDLGRMPFGGVMDFGANNLEGRVAWSQVYYLHGLFALLQSHPLGMPDARWTRAVQRRLVDEAAYTARLVSSRYPSLAARRYSIDREPLLFALHLGRVADLLGKLAEAGLGTSVHRQALATIESQLVALEDTVEERTLQGGSAGRLPTLGYRRGVPFWADGANVPHNYVSGYIAGLLAAPDARGKRRAGQLARFILESEFSGKSPRTWRYWAGTGDAGWKEPSGISLNTPSWSGNLGAAAHITYRTMDAAALAQLHRIAPVAVPRALIEHFRRLTSKGWLLPSVNEELTRQGRGVRLEPSVARYYARSAAPWEIQAQVSALRELAR